MKKLITVLTLFILTQILIIQYSIKRLDMTAGSIEPFIFSGLVPHIVAFMATAFLFAMILTHRYVNINFPFFLTFVYTSGFAIFVETLQYQIPYRDFAMSDIFVGILTAALFCLFMSNLAERSKGIKRFFFD